LAARSVGSVEDPDAILKKILAWAMSDDRIAAVVVTGSRGRGDRVDEYSDLDVELISPCPLDLASADQWIEHVGQPLVVLPFDQPDLTTRLVVLPGGRKVDFSIWPETRISEMGESGLNELYDRGYTVLLDKAGITERLPAASIVARPPDPPDQHTFRRLESEFWFGRRRSPSTYVEVTSGSSRCASTRCTTAS